MNESLLLESAIQRAALYLISQQKSDGGWAGEVELNPGPTAQVIMLHAALGLELNPRLQAKAKNYILRMQQSDGGWAPHAQAPSDISVSAECYVALRLLGEPALAPQCWSAAKFIENQGGPYKSNTWTQLYMAFLGVLDWNKVQRIPIETLLAPSFLPIAIENLSYWVNVITVPMALLGHVGPGKPIALARKLAGELGLSYAPTKSGFSVLDFARRPLQHLAIKTALRKIEAFTESNGDLGGNTCTALNCLLAFACLGKEEDPSFKKSFDALMNYGIETETEWHVQTCQSDVWDTGFATYALPDNPRFKDSIDLATLWLKDRQILNTRGPWQRKNSAEPGGWCFGNRHEHYPVTDCTAIALLALEKQSPNFAEHEAAQRGIAWLLGMQNESGGWSAYEKSANIDWINKILQFKDIPNALTDPPKADVTAKVVEALCKWRRDTKVENALVQARAFLLSAREANGLWRGNYGINYIYGTSFVARALRELDQRTANDWAPRVEKFFLDKQNADGGWGESEESYRDSAKAGTGKSTITQTAWALMGLMASSEGNETKVRVAIRKGLVYLIARQKADGSWQDDVFLGTVFPGMVYFRYHLYAQYFPLMALQQAYALLNDPAGLKDEGGSEV